MGIIFVINFTLISVHNFGGIIVSCLVSSASFLISTSSLRLIMLVTINAEMGVDRFAHGYEFPPLLLLAALAGPPIAGPAEKEFGFYLDLDRACQDDAASSLSEILRSLAGSVKFYVYRTLFRGL